MSVSRIEDEQLDPKTLARLTQSGPVIVTHDGMPLFVAHQISPELLEALAVEEDRPGDMLLEDYARLYHISLDAESYVREFPDDAPFTVSPAKDD